MLDLHHLPGTDIKEKNIHVLRAHPITLMPFFFLIILLFLLPFIGSAVLHLAFPVVFTSPILLTLIIMGASLFFLYAWLFLFEYFMEYWLDVDILTDKRILDIDQKGLFGRVVSELRLYRAQDVTAEVKGMWHTMFDYGDVYIQSAAEVERFHFVDVPHPNQITKLILDYAEIDRREHLEEAVEEFGTPGGEKHEQVARKIEP